MPKFRNGETTIPAYRDALMIETMLRIGERGTKARQLTRENLIDWLMVKALEKPTHSSRVLPTCLKIHPCNLTGKPNSEGYHRIGWDTLVRGFDSLGLEVVFEIREKTNAKA